VENITIFFSREGRLSLRFTWILPSSGTLRSVGWLKTDVSGLPIVPETSVLNNLLCVNTPEDGRMFIPCFIFSFLTYFSTLLYLFFFPFFLTSFMYSVFSNTAVATSKLTNIHRNITHLNSQHDLFQQTHNLNFICDKLGLHVSVYQAIIWAPITKNTENTASQNKS
jgi:hypothetical protein